MSRLVPSMMNIGFPDGSVVKNPPVNAGDTGDMGLIPGLEKSSGEGNGNPFQFFCFLFFVFFFCLFVCFCLGNPMDRGT